jgi:N-acetyl-alpha-D-muramate 1-phosphate uridylyltransferase
MPDSVAAGDVAAVVLAAGAGTRLRPLTALLPKPLCPIANVALIDLALDRVEALVGAGADSVAVNVHHHAGRLLEHLGGRVHVSIEAGAEALGTAGAVGALRPWVAGRPVVVVNGDTWSTIPLDPLLDGWDGERVRVLVHGPPGTEVAPGVEVVASVLPAPVAAGIPAEVLGLTNGVWWPARDAGMLESVAVEGPFVSCDRPHDYLAANLAASGGASVVGSGAVVDGELVRSVVWPGGRVEAGEVLIDAVRVGARLTVLVR